MRKIIKYVIAQEFETLDTYPSLIEPLANKFSIDIKIAEGIINAIIEWERSSSPNSLEKTLCEKFPDVVTN